jgi:hypothetical protein
MWRTGGVTPWGGGGLQPGRERGELPVGCRMVRHVGVDEVAPGPDDLDQAVGLGLGRRLAQHRPLGRGRAAAGQAGVELEVDPSGPSGPGGGGDDLVELGRRRGREIHVGDERRVEWDAGRDQPGQYGFRNRGLTERQRLVQRADAQPAGAAAQRRPGHRNEPVTIRVRLHDGHDLGRRARAQAADVGLDRVKIDAHLRLPHV